MIFQLLKWIALMDYFNILNERVEKHFLFIFEYVELHASTIYSYIFEYVFTFLVSKGLSIFLGCEKKKEVIQSEEK
jgi:hypothetical protein